MSESLVNLFELNESELYESLGKEGGRGFGPSDLTRAGKEIFENCWDVVADIVCRSTKIRTVSDISQGDGTEVASAILDCIISSLHGVSAVTVAVLIVKRGLPRLCSTRWK